MSERLDVRPPSLKNRPEPRVLVVEHPSEDRAARWARVLALLLEAGAPDDPDEED